ncbi:MAG: extracellular solute-binding protein [Candidatus Eisenbacteria bacterium]|mgnify:CR=1 FL=1|nr:extracellular solute-binding protein [Candidatus Eisenbacteria bacterium]
MSGRCVHELRMIVVAALIIGVGACGGGGGSTSKDGRRGASATKIVIWEQMDPKEVTRFDRHLNAYMAAHPEVRVEHSHFNTEDLRSQFQNAANAGGGPDLVYGPSDQVGPFSVLKIILPLDTLIPASTLANFHPAAFDTLDGHIWAIPDQIGNHLVLVYNKDLVPTAPADFNALIDAARKLTVDDDGDGTPDRYGLAFETNEPFWLIPFLTASGGWVMDATGQPTLGTPAMVDALRFLADLKNKVGIVPKECNYQLMDTLFKEKKTPFIINGPWSWQDYIDSGINLGLAPIPPLEPGGRRPAPMAAAKGYSINANVPAERKAAVLALLEYLTSPEVVADFPDLLILPSRREILDSPKVTGNPLLVASRQAYEAGRRMPVTPQMRAIWDAMRPVQQSVMNGSLRPEAAAAQMQKDAVSKIAAMMN